MDIENFFQDTLEDRIKRLEKKNIENESNILRILEYLKLNNNIGTIDQIKNINKDKNKDKDKDECLEKRIIYLESRNIIIEKALLGIIERL